MVEVRAPVVDDTRGNPPERLFRYRALLRIVSHTLDMTLSPNRRIRLSAPIAKTSACAWQYRMPGCVKIVRDTSSEPSAPLSPSLSETIPVEVPDGEQSAP